MRERLLLFYGADSITDMMLCVCANVPGGGRGACPVSNTAVLVFTMLDKGDSGGPLVVQARAGENYDLLLSTSVSCLVAMTARRRSEWLAGVLG